MIEYMPRMNSKFPFIRLRIQGCAYGSPPGARCPEAARVPASKLMDGVGMSIERNDVSGAESLVRQGAGIGMKNVRERLEVQYGSSAKVEVNSRPGRGTKVTLCMPVVEPSMWPEGGMQMLEAAVNAMDDVISRATRARGQA